MICDKCGFNNKDSFKSCTNCGARLQSISKQEVQHILDKASDESEPLEFKVSNLDRVNACISFGSIPILLIFLILSSADIIQFIGIPLASALSGFIAISPHFAKMMVAVRNWPFSFSGNYGKATRKLLSWGFLAMAIISTMLIFFKV